MSTSLLYHVFGCANYTYLKTEYREGMVTFFIEKKRDKRKCAQCKSREVISSGGRNYRLRSVPIGAKRVFINVYLRRLLCKSCGHLAQEAREIAEPRKSYTRQLARLVIDLSQRMTLKDICEYLHLKWHLVRDIVRTHLTRKEERRSWRDVRLIALDEIAVRKGHRYMTVVVDLVSGNVLEAVDGRKAISLKPVFDRLKRAGAKLEAVGMDMWKPYVRALKDYWPSNVTVVHDPFHIVKKTNEAIAKVRKTAFRQMTEKAFGAGKGIAFYCSKQRRT